MFTSRCAWPARWPIRPILGFWGSKVHKNEISCLRRRRTAVKNLTPLALFSADKSVTVQTHKQTNKQWTIYPHLAYRHVWIIIRRQNTESTWSFPSSFPPRRRSAEWRRPARKSFRLSVAARRLCWHSWRVRAIASVIHAASTSQPHLANSFHSDWRSYEIVTSWPWLARPGVKPVTWPDLT